VLRPIFWISLGEISVGAGRGSRTPKTRRSADFESAASASSAIPAWFEGEETSLIHASSLCNRHAFWSNLDVIAQTLSRWGVEVVVGGVSASRFLTVRVGIALTCFRRHAALGVDSLDTGYARHYSLPTVSRCR
jgi:hypothetical protein